MPRTGALAALAPSLPVAAWCAPAFLWSLRKKRDPLVDHGLKTRPQRGLEMLAFFLILPVYVLALRLLGSSFEELDPFAFLAIVGQQLIFTALPEEYFFRGVLQPALSRAWGRIPGILATTALFALAHLVLELSIARLLTFFPGLVFASMRERSGSIVPGTLFHALCNGVYRWIPL